jgi:GDP-L-fucose synthase
MIRKFHDAREDGLTQVTVWGSGKPRREFLHVDDLADACLFLMEKFDEPFHINVGTGEDVAVGELADMVRRIVHPTATIVYDDTKPDGPPRKLLDVSRLHDLGWRHRISLGEGIEQTYRRFLVNHDHFRGARV